VLSAVIYAPLGSVKIAGNGDICGSAIANDIYFHGQRRLIMMDRFGTLAYCLYDLVAIKTAVGWPIVRPPTACS
jgi:hypothetical protein